MADVAVGSRRALWLADGCRYASPRLAVIHRETRIDYDQLQTRVRACARELRALGLLPGQLVVVPDTPALEFLVMQHALAVLDGGLLPVAASCPQGDQDLLAEMAGAEWRWRPGASGAGALLALRPRTNGWGGRAHAALVIGTSGSTGTPKAAMLTRENVLASCRLANRCLDLRAGDTWLSCLPRHHVGGLLIAYRCAIAGATCLLQDRFDAPVVARVLVRHRVTHISLVPPMLAELLTVADAPPQSLRTVLVGGQSLSAALARKAIAAGWPLHVTYGMTETCSQVATSGVLSAVPESGVVGPVLPGVEVECAGCAARPVRLRIRGPIVMAGYARPGREPGLGLEDGWFTTSDLGCRTAEGDLRVLGRADDLVVIGGEFVVPSQVEERLLGAPGVLAAVVVGAEDSVWGRRLVAVYAGDSSPDELDQWCRGHLGSRDRPRVFRRLDQLPALPSGKQDRRRIREMIAHELLFLG
jgi:O-succinylbenzoic acid--CoA ligase